jgi:hypothetical protein
MSDSAPKKQPVACANGYKLVPGDMVLIPAVIVATFEDGRHFNLRVETTSRQALAATLGLNEKHVYLDLPGERVGETP